MFCIGLGAVVSLLIKDKQSGIYVYIPFFMLNLTLGGAVWGRLFDTNQLFRFFMPVAVFLDASASQYLFESTIMATLGLMLLLIGLFFVTFFARGREGKG
jgi:hypothetical protein